MLTASFGMKRKKINVLFVIFDFFCKNFGQVTTVSSSLKQFFFCWEILYEMALEV